MIERPTKRTEFVAILHICAKKRDLCRGSRLHDDVLRRGLLQECSDALVTMYAKCGALAKAKALFDMHTSRDLFTWTALISGCAHKGQGHKALHYFDRMQSEGLSPDAVTYTCVLKACGSIRAADRGAKIHDEISQRGLLRDSVALGTTLVDMYAKCGSLARARRVLEELPVRDAVSWNALISGYAEHKDGEEALSCFELMQKDGIAPNAVTFICILKACASMGAVAKGKEIHNEIAKQGLLGNNILLRTALVDMYAKCGDMRKAQEVFDELSVWDVISWNALIAGYAEHGEVDKALSCFECMRSQGLSPDMTTFVSLLKACGSSRAADKGEAIYGDIDQQGLPDSDVVLGTALVDMYAKCGALVKACRVLEKLPLRSIFTWNALLAGYAEYGKGLQALRAFEQMQCEGLSPDTATISCVLSACSHGGLLEDAQMFFVLMGTNYHLKLDFEHYTCMIDLFGRAGHLHRAVGMIQQMPSCTIIVWSALLGASQKWGDVEVGRWAFQHAVQADRCDPAVYVLMANIYIAAGMHEHAERIEIMRTQREAQNKANDW